eukprot:scaffold803_cov310-Pinguiococcus_pyrenoidosus.AAC.59
MLPARSSLATTLRRSGSAGMIFDRNTFFFTVAVAAAAAAEVAFEVVDAAAADACELVDAALSGEACGGLGREAELGREGELGREAVLGREADFGGVGGGGACGSRASAGGGGGVFAWETAPLRAAGAEADAAGIQLGRLETLLRLLSVTGLFLGRDPSPSSDLSDSKRGALLPGLFCNALLPEASTPFGFIALLRGLAPSWDAKDVIRV